MEQQNPEEKIKEIQFDILNQAPLLGKYAILMKETKYSPRLFTHEFQKRIFKNILATTLCLPTQELSNSLIYHISPLWNTIIGACFGDFWITQQISIINSNAFEWINRNLSLQLDMKNMIKSRYEYKIMEYLIINKPLITISQAVQYKLELRKIVNIEIISKPIQISTCQTSYPPSAEIIKIESEIQSISDQTQSESIQKTLETSSELFEISLQMALLPSIVSISTSIYHLEDKISVIPCIDNFSLKIDTKIEEHKERDFNFDVRSSYSFYSGMDTPLTTTTMMSFDEGFDFEPCVGFAIERFLGEVDGFFVCAACEKVVRKPKECTSCQNLMCKYCAYSQMKCPYGCEDLNLHRPSKFALIVYHRLKLRCSYFESGCEFVGRIKDMKDHELVCLYEVVKCQSQICNNTFTKKDKNKGETAPLVCSEMCESLVEFKKILDNSSREAILQEFSNYLIKMSVVSEEEIERELTEILNEKEQKQAEAKLFLEIKGGLLTELENRRNKNHPGKWNSGSKKWSCCNEQDKYSIGCRDI